MTFIVWIAFIHVEQKKNLNIVKKSVKKKKKDFCGLIMPSKDSKIFEFNQHLKSDQIPSTIHTDLESLIQKIDGCKNNFVKFNVYNMDIWWYRKQAWCVQRWQWHEQFLWVFKGARNEDN